MVLIYTKTNWTEAVPLSPSNLNNIETQYAEAMSKAANIWADNGKPIIVQTVSSFPSAGTVGRVIFHTGHNRLYVANGINWNLREIGGGADHFYNFGNIATLAGGQTSTHHATLTMPKRGVLVGMLGVRSVHSTTEVTFTIDGTLVQFWGTGGHNDISSVGEKVVNSGNRNVTVAFKNTSSSDLYPASGVSVIAIGKWLEDL